MSESSKKKVLEPYRSRTDAELEALAQDIVAGRVFSTLYNGRLIEESGLSLESIFMSLIFVGPEWWTWAEASKIHTLYEYVEKASPLGVNGCPSFFSFSALSEDDVARLHERVRAIHEFQLARRAEAGG